MTRIGKTTGRAVQSGKQEWIHGVAKRCRRMLGVQIRIPQWKSFTHPRDFPGKNTGIVCHFLLQGIFLTQGMNPGFLHCRQIFFFFLQPWTSQFEYLQLLFYVKMLNSYQTLYSILLGHFPLHFMSHFRQELFPRITICLIVCCCCSAAKLCTTLQCHTLQPTRLICL